MEIRQSSKLPVSEGMQLQCNRKKAMHPRNKYAEKSPDFSLLASLYPSFASFVVYGAHGKPRIDWTDFNATRELTRVLLEHDYTIKWWIPDGQLCPTVPNRANYIHWIEDLLTMCPAPWHSGNNRPIKGLDIGTGANCIYPLLGASLHGWHFVGTDITPIAIDSATTNVEGNPHLAELIEIRPVSAASEAAEHKDKLPVLEGVVTEDETFDFCMCNPPFFEDISEANANPRTACGGTKEEMVCQGGEAEFIRRIIDDSAVLKNRIQWYTSMVGRKINLKALTAHLRSLGVTMLRTTEFVQGRTSRWGIAWSFGSPSKAINEVKIAARVSRTSFMLEGLGRQWTAAEVLRALGSEMMTLGAQCSVDMSSFSITGSLSGNLSTSPEFSSSAPKKRSREQFEDKDAAPEWAADESEPERSSLFFKTTVLQQAPGSLLIQTALMPGQTHDENLTGQFSVFAQQAELSIRYRLKTKSNLKTRSA